MPRLIALLLLFVPSVVRGAPLQADELLLIVNANDPASVALAEHYAMRREVPDGRILALDLPSDETIAFDDYHNRVAPAVRAFLQDNDLRQQVRCAVTFRGVPLKIADRQPGQADDQEQIEIAQLTEQAMTDLREGVALAEALAGAVDPAFQPTDGDGLNGLLQRLTAAQKVISAGLGGASTTRPALLQQLNAVRERVTRSVVPPGWESPKIEGDPTARAQQLARRTEDAEARRELREIVRSGGPVGLLQVLEAHSANQQAKQTGASFDSELSCLWWPVYPKRLWQPNLLRQADGGGQQTLMTARIDGPSDELCRRIIDESVAVEQIGLRGKIALDARGILPRDADGKLNSYGVYDETIRQALLLLRDKLEASDVIFDNNADVLQPGSGEGVAVYIGWYSVKKYVPGVTFVPGAVGFHIASFEMTTLRGANAPGWVPGLLKDGVDATLGPVREPYLSAFPPAHDFLALLLTGEHTLAEVYWRTVPLTSWEVGLIGDPLYRPFALTPILDPADVPERLRHAGDAADQ